MNHCNKNIVVMGLIVRAITAFRRGRFFCVCKLFDGYKYVVIPWRVVTEIN